MKTRRLVTEFLAGRFWKSLSTWVVLLVCLATAFSGWWAYLHVGATWVHRELVEQHNNEEKKKGVVPPASVFQFSLLPSTTPQALFPGLFFEAPQELSSTSASIEGSDQWFAELGQSGDAFGGANALFAALAGGLVLWAGWLQARALKESREQYHHERVESIFFQLVDLSRNLLSSIKIEENQNSITGPRALEQMARELFGRTASVLKEADSSDRAVADLIMDFRTTVYEKHAATIGPYLRLLFQTFKHIANSNISNDAKITYSNIARGQIGEGAVLLLALNGLTQVGNPFIRYIEQFGLLEHMLPTYADVFKRVMLAGYRDAAFQGSEKRPPTFIYSGSLKKPSYFEEIAIANYPQLAAIIRSGQTLS